MAINGLLRTERGASALDQIAASQTANIAQPANIQQRRGFAGANLNAHPQRTLDEEKADREWDTVIPPPEADPLMFYGALGRLARQSADQTEVNAVAAMAASMSWASAAMGRNRAIVIGDEWHHLRLFTLHVGRSARGGKGMALGLLKRVIKAIHEHPEGIGLLPQKHDGGLSTREGLAVLIHDGYREGKEDIPPIEDKRLFVVESEFANVLAQGKRDGNTLSTCLRDVWDGAAIKPATKSSRIWASRPHIALHGCITPTELRARLATNDLSNGFANRFLTVWGERTGVIPFPHRASNQAVANLAAEWIEIIRYGLAGYPMKNEPLPISMSYEAAGLYADCYRDFAMPHPVGELIGGLLQRRSPMLLRIAGLFAVTDLVDQISRDHIEAARAWMVYFGKSIQMIFGPAVDVEREVHRSDDANKLYAWLKDRKVWQSRKSITKECFQGHVLSSAIDTAIEQLALDDLVERQEVDSGGPRKRTEYRLKDVTSRLEKTNVRRGSQLGSQAQTLVDVERSQSTQCSQPQGEAAEVVEGDV